VSLITVVYANNCIIDNICFYVGFSVQRSILKIFAVKLGSLAHYFCVSDTLLIFFFSHHTWLLILLKEYIFMVLSGFYVRLIFHCVFDSRILF